MQKPAIFLATLALVFCLGSSAARAADTDKMLAMFHCSSPDGQVTSLLRVYENLATKVDRDSVKGTNIETDFTIISKLIKFGEEKLDFQDDKSKQKLHIPKNDSAKIIIQLEGADKDASKDLNCERLQGSLL